MKQYTLLFLLSLFICTAARANSIDSLKTDEAVLKFINELFIEKYEATSNYHYNTFTFKKPDSTFSLYPCDSLITSWPTKSWQKIDFNKDGLTDLFTIIYQRDTVNSRYAEYTAYAVIADTAKPFQLIEIPNFFLFHCYAVKPIFIKQEPFLLYRHYRTDFTVDSMPTGPMPLSENFHYFEVGKTDTLLFKFGAFIELSRKISRPIKSIFYETSGCLGGCPVFKMNIFKSGQAYYTASSFSDKEGNFQTKIKEQQLKEIFDLLSYLNLDHLENYYTESATDYPTCNLSIFFEDGSVKNINDYGEHGTLGLVKLYDLLFALREHQDWQ